MSNQISLESPSGVLNKAFYQLSGKYKIYISSRSNGYKTYLSDYTGYKFEFDLNLPFLSQLSKFLRTETKVSSQIKYGGYRKNDIKTYHIPYYFGLDNKPYPESFTLLRTNNQDIETPTNLYNNFPVDIINIKPLHKIFDELLDLKHVNSIPLNYPVSLVWNVNNQHQIVLHGWNFITECVESIPVNIFDYVFNMIQKDDSIDFLSSLILEEFEKNHLIFPRFINFEFEFDYNDYIDFQDFFGFLSNNNILNRIPNNVFPSDKKTIISYLKNDNFNYFEEFRQPNLQNNLLNNRTIETQILYVQDIHEQPEQITFNINNLSINNTLQFFDGENLLLNYQVIQSDIKDTLYKTLIYVFNKITNISNGIIQSKVTFINDNNIEINLKFPTKINFKLFNGNLIKLDLISESIKLNDVQLINYFDNIDNIDHIVINNTTYNILKTFTFNGYKIFRLDNNPKLTSKTKASIFEKQYEKFIELKPVDYINYINLLTIPKTFDFDKYKLELHNRLGIDITHLENISTYKDSYNILDKDNIPDIFFKQSNCNDLSIHTLNYDMDKFSIDNHCSNTNFNFFLIKLRENSLVPNYVLNDQRKYLYTNDSIKFPHLRSLIYRINDNWCQTIFLGKSYKLHVQYEGYHFSVIYDYDNQFSENPQYYVNVDIVNKTVDLVINYYFPFSNIMRYANKSMFDLSLFNIKYASLIEYSSQSEIVYSFNNFGIYFGNMINNNHVQELKSIPGYDNITSYCDYDNDRFIVYRTPNTFVDFTIFQNSTEITLNKFVKITYLDENSKEQTKLVKYVTLILKDIIDLRQNFLSCRDIVVKMFEDGFYYDSENVISIEISSENLPKELQEKFTHDVTKVITDNETIIITSDESIRLMLFYLQDLTTLIPTNVLQQQVSLRDQWCRLIYHKDSSIEVKTFPNTYASNLTQEEIEERINPNYNSQEFIDMISNMRDSSFEIDFFNYNPFFTNISLLSQSLVTYYQNLESINHIFKNISFKNLDNYLENNFLSIYDNDILNPNEYPIKISVIEQDINQNSDLKNVKRFSTYYEPHFDITNALNFQEDTGNIRSLLSHVSPPNWQENFDSILSTLFVGNDIIINSIFDNNTIDLSTLLLSKIDMYKIPGILRGLDDVTKSHFKKEYSKYLLNNIYNPSTVIVNGKNTKFDYDRNRYLITISDNLRINNQSLEIRLIKI